MFFVIVKLWVKCFEILSRKLKNLEDNKCVSLEKKEGKYKVSKNIGDLYICVEIFFEFLLDVRYYFKYNILLE